MIFRSVPKAPLWIKLLAGVFILFLVLLFLPVILLLIIFSLFSGALRASVFRFPGKGQDFSCRENDDPDVIDAEVISSETVGEPEKKTRNRN